MYYYDVNDPTTSTNGGQVLAGTPIQEQALNSNASSIVKRYSNIGGDNPAKSEHPLPRSLFYDGAKLDPDSKQAEKYGLFMFYSFGGGQNNFLDQYYLSERSEYNRLISTPASKNPTAFQLVKDTSQYSPLLLSTGNSTTEGSPIKGGLHAPYYWKDFIYCKYYGTIPNNRLITLRRFSSPVLDNFSLPPGLKTPENQKLGVGMPVAQAVTWFGGNSGNRLSDLIGFSTGLAWGTENINEERIQQAFGDGLLNSTAFKTLTSLTTAFSATNTGNESDEDFTIGAEAIATSLSAAGDDLTKSRYFRAFYDAIKEDSDGRFGILSERIWVPVDVIKNTSYRTFGLEFTWTDLVLKFTYDLTSAGEVNTKAAMFDILGNLLSIGTNYGNFLAPYIRYDSKYSALTFPGGDDGARDFNTDPAKFISDNLSKLLVSDNSSSRTIGGSEINKSELEDFKTQLQELSKQFKEGTVTFEEGGLFDRIIKGIKSGLGKQAAEDWQAPLSLYTGAAIGEWHVVLGNPYNPIAMIGNLICTDVSIDFGDSLGPDDFPNTLEASITLQHARPRERGEIESIFNQGDGRLYQNVKSTTANAQTYNATVDLAGQVFTQRSVNSFFSPENGGVAGSGSPTTFGDIELGERE
jgi:hypothetical protein